MYSLIVGPHSCTYMITCRTQVPQLLCAVYDTFDMQLIVLVEIRCKLKTDAPLGKVLGLYPGMNPNKKIW
jgi:hypothetical protein